MRLIDADEIQFENVDFDTYDDYCTAFDAIDNAPTVEQPTGEWILVNPIQMDIPGGYKCSVCGSGDYSIQIGVDKYCKFCGAKMKGGEVG